MNIRITVRRQASPEEKPYLQSFEYEGDGNLTVADWLTEVNQGEAKTNRISWECGCQEEKCGGCAMRINGVPVLACAQFLKDIATKEGSQKSLGDATKNRLGDPSDGLPEGSAEAAPKLTSEDSAIDGYILLEPLSKFPLVKDLTVDRTSMFDILREMKVWTDDTGGTDYGKDRELELKAGECLQCGCCLEVCPNFLAGKNFSGAAGLVAAYRAIEQNAQDAHRQEMKKEYRKKFFAGCGQSLSCQEVCPKNLPIDAIQARANHR